MHPNRATAIALKDLRGHPSVPMQTSRRMGLGQLVSRIARAWFSGWTWYVRQGMAPMAMDAVPAIREWREPRVRRMVPASLARWVTPSAPLPVAQLYDCATPAGCA